MVIKIVESACHFVSLVSNVKCLEFGCCFLNGIWKEGGLQGGSVADAFQVDIGLGSTMTAEDLLDGCMRVSVLVAVVHPAEFIEITFEQEMAKSG